MFQFNEECAACSTAVGLQSAFAYANSNPSEQVIINLTAGGAYNLTNIGTQLLDKSTAGITINGNGATITAAANNRIVEVDSGDQLALNNLTVTGGNLTLQNGCQIANNQAVGSSANSSSATNASGGGLYVDSGTVSITASTISYNDAWSGLDASGTAYNAYGGGLCIIVGSNVIVTNSTLSNNSARGSDAASTSASTGFAEGGGLYVEGASGNVTITGSTLVNNSALSGSSNNIDASAAMGGGACVFNNGMSFNLLSTSFFGNTAQGSAGDSSGDTYGGDAYGGALYYGASSTTLSSPSLTIKDSGFDTNSAIGGTSAAGASAGGASGGAVNVYLYDASCTATIINSSFTNNNATGGSGGTSSTGGGAAGAGISASGSGNLTLINTTLGANTAQDGNLDNSTIGAAGGGLYDSNAAVTLINDTIAFNAALAGSGTAAAEGGGIYSDGSSPALTNVILASNSATTGGSDFWGSVGTSSGYDFISNTTGISNASALSSLPGMILNNTTPQLDTLTLDPITGLVYYPLLANSQVIGAGTTSVVNTIAAAEGVPLVVADATDEIGNPRVVNNTIDMGAATFLGNSAVVSGGVWLDSNGDGILDNGETGIQGITVNLEDPTGTVLMTTTTDQYGRYRFIVDPSPGSQYKIQVIIPDGTDATYEYAGAYPQIYSSIDSDGYSDTFAFRDKAPINLWAGFDPRLPPLTTYTVTTLTDNAPQTGGVGAGNAGDLRYCLTQANLNPGSRNKIVFQNGLQGTIQLQAKLPEIKQETTIVGPGANLITVQGNATVGNLYSIFTIDTGVIAEIDSLSIQGGRNIDGGGIYNGGTLALKYDTIAGNTASRGGGIFNWAHDLYLSNDVIQNNDATDGGGIYNDGSITDGFLDTTEISSNQATEHGGAIFNKDKVNFSGSIEMNYNMADMTQGQGGAVYNSRSGNFQMSGGTIGPLNGAFQGGGVYNAGTLTLELGTTVGGNEANQGGGLYLAANSTTTLDIVTISGNNLEGNNPAAPGIGYIKGAKMNLTKLTDDDDPKGKPVEL